MITEKDIKEIKETIVNSAESMYTDEKSVGDYATEKGKKDINKAFEMLEQVGIESFRDLFDLIKRELGIDINHENFIPKEVYVQEFIGEDNVCLAYYEINDLELFIKSQLEITVYYQCIMKKENGKWLIDATTKN
jgi:regulatory protein YycH of two-component signal transduction system YycFG